MTAILIGLSKENSKEYLYLAADQRITTQDYVVSDSNVKIFSYDKDERHPHRRHYVTAGDVHPTDYLISKLEQLENLNDFHIFMAENEIVSKMKANLTFYVVVETPGRPLVVQVYKSDEYVGTVAHDLKELKDNPIFDGSGGLAVISAYRALEAVTNLKESMTTQNFVQLAFSSAARHVFSMNDKLTFLKIPVKLKKGK